MPDPLAPPAVLLVTGAPASVSALTEDATALAREIAAAAPHRSAWLHVGPGGAPFPCPAGLRHLDLHDWGRRHGRGSSRPWPPRAKDLLVGGWTLGRRRIPALLVGWDAVSALPALHRHRAPIIWLPGPGGPESPPCRELDRVQAVVSTDDATARAVVAASDGWLAAVSDRHRPLLGWTAQDDPPLAAPPLLRAHGPADVAGGLDLLGRALTTARRDLEEIGAHVEWTVAAGSPAPRSDDLADLESMGVAGVIDITTTDAGQRAGWARATVAVSVARETRWAPRVAGAVAAAGVPVVGWSDVGPPPGVPPDRFAGVPFPDTTALGCALVSAVRATAGTPHRHPTAAPAGLSALLTEVTR